MNARRCCWRGSASCCAASGSSGRRSTGLCGLSAGRERGHEQTFQRLAPQLTEAIRAKLDGLLVTDGGQ